MAVNVNSLKSQPLKIGVPIIKVLGVGGGGGNVINRMVEDNIKGVEYIAINTDLMVLKSSNADLKIQIGEKITRGMGAGMKPQIGRISAEENLDSLSQIFNNTDLVFIAAGMGGGTGTGAAPVIAEIAKEKKVLTIGVVTTPFSFEGSKRGKIADQGLIELRNHVDTLIVVSNNKLLEMASKKTSVSEAFLIADDVLKQAISGITNLINLEGVINLDFADLQTIMCNKGAAIMGTGFGFGESRGCDAVHKAITSTILDQPIEGANGIIVNIVADEQFTILDAEAAVDCVQKSANQDADIIFGLVYDPGKKDEVFVSVIATGF